MTPYPDSTPFGCGRPGPERSVTHRLAADPPQALSLDQVWALLALRTSTPSRPGSSSVSGQQAWRRRLRRVATGTPSPRDVRPGMNAPKRLRQGGRQVAP